MPAVRVVLRVTVSGARAATDVVAGKSTAVRLWLPVTVPAAKTTCELPAATACAGYVQPFEVRIVPGRVSVPEDLLMTNAGRLPLAVVEAPVRVWAPAPVIARVVAPPP